MCGFTLKGVRDMIITQSGFVNIVLLLFGIDNIFMILKKNDKSDNIIHDSYNTSVLDNNDDDVNNVNDLDLIYNDNNKKIKCIWPTCSFSSSFFFFSSSSLAMFAISSSRRRCSACRCFLLFGFG